MNFKIKLISLVISLLLFSCANGMENSSAQVIPAEGLDSLSLASLVKQDGYPFYTMTYYGDYNFAELAGRDGIAVSSGRDLTKSDFPFGCTCFAALANDNAIFGRNFDWECSIPLLLYTDPPNGYASVSTVDIEFLGYSRQNLPDNPGNRGNLLNAPRWPFDGMNEKGVAIGMMAVSSGRGPFDASKISLGEIDAIRLVLDFAATTEEAIQLLGEYNIIMENPPIHYLIADRSGHSAIVEFLSGEMIVIRNDEPWQVSTNFIIHNSGAPEHSTCWRYNSAYNQLQSSGGNISSSQAMDLLQSVSSSTKWSVVYDTGSSEIKIVVGQSYNSVYTFDLGKFDN